MLRDLAVMLADGGDCLSDLAVLREQPELFGPVASTPTAWRVVERLAQDPDGLARLRAARAHARARAWAAGADPDLELLVIDADATLVTAHSDAKEGAAGTYKHTFGFHPLLAYLDRGKRPGEPLAGMLRPGNAAPGAADDLIELVDLALAQLPSSASDQPVLVRSDSAGASTRLAWHLRDQRGRVLARHADRRPCPRGDPGPARARLDPSSRRPTARPAHGAEVGELTGWIDLHTWPAGTRAICRREDAHPGAQLRFTDHDGHRFQVFLTDQPDPDLAQLELRHRQRARVEDRIRAAKATGLRNLPFDRWRRNRVWLELVLAAQDLHLLDPGAAAGRRARRGRAQDPALPAACTSPPGSSATPAGSSCACNATWPWAAALAQGVHPAAGAAAALLTITDTRPTPDRPRRHLGVPAVRAHTRGRIAQSADDRAHRPQPRLPTPPDAATRPHGHHQRHGQPASKPTPLLMKSRG